jgi:hypothetical protein
MRLIRRAFKALTITAAVLVATAAVALAAGGYLHVANAQSYAIQHVWNSNCNALGGCSSVSSTGYKRYGNTQVWVYIRAATGSHGICTRGLMVSGDDSTAHITDGSLWACDR